MQSRSWLLLLALFFWPVWGNAQGLTEPQYQALRNDVLVTHASEFATQVANNDFQPIADAYNLAASPAFWVWKTSLSAKTIYEETDADGGIWDWSVHMAQTVAERGAWDTMFFSPPINPSLPQTRAAFQKIYSGNTTQQNAQKAHLLAISRRTALRGEALLANTSAGNGSAATPATASYEGRITYADVNHAVTGAPLP